MSEFTKKEVDKLILEEYAAFVRHYEGYWKNKYDNNIAEFVQFIKNQEDFIQDHEHSWDFEVLWDNLVKERKKWEERIK